MSKFNTATVNRTKTTNLAGGEAYTQAPELELASILLTSFVEDSFYRSAGDTNKRVGELLTQVDPEFAAKAAIFARDRFGMRSISHVVAGELAGRVSGLPWAKDFYSTIVVRPDDMTEIMSYFKSKTGLTSTKAMQKGFANAFGKFDAYQLAKYRGKGKEFSLVDVANLVHPRPTEKNATALAQLIEGTLRSTGTWEAELTKAGQKAETAEEKAENKKEAWGEMVRSRKIGYFALLRNLRNIATDAPDVLDEALVLLVDRKLIKKSRVLPFRFLTAYTQFFSEDVAGKQKILNALSDAMDIAVDNVPTLDGRTLLALDTSSSMLGYGGYYGRMDKLDPKAPAVIGAQLMAALFKKNPDNTDLMVFEGVAEYITLDGGDATLSITRQIVNRVGGGSTNTPDVFARANKAYDRVIILSDMQTWVTNSYSYGGSCMSWLPKSAYQIG